MPAPDENLDEIELFSREIDEDSMLSEPSGGTDNDYVAQIKEERILEKGLTYSGEGFGANIRKEGSYPLESRNLTGRVEEVDEFFNDTEFKPVLYTVEDTHYSLMTGGSISENQTVVLGMEGKMRDNANKLQSRDFDRFEGEYISPASVDEVLIKLGEPEQESLPADMALDNIDLQVPISGFYTPDGMPSIDYQ